MERKILDCVKKAENLAKNGTPDEIKKRLFYFERWLEYFMHERMVHLIVTVLFSLLSMLALILFFSVKSLPILVVFGIFITTDCFYIKHYYVLENKVQQLYDIIDVFYSKIDKNL